MGELQPCRAQMSRTYPQSAQTIIVVRNRDNSDSDLREDGLQLVPLGALLFVAEVIGHNAVTLKQTYFLGLSLPSLPQS
jgi:hypothetical protein